jgi:hypothetical protein
LASILSADITPVRKLKIAIEREIWPHCILNDGELDGRIESIQFEGENVASFTAKDRSFMGLAVPPSCKRRFILEKENN